MRNEANHASYAKKRAMRHRILTAVLLAICAVTLGLPACASVASTGPATVADCANPALPLSILDRPAPISTPVSEPPLEMTQATAAHVTLELAVARDQSSRELGLMCVLRLRSQHGMIFVFDGDKKQEFWMKNTLISLDMVWVRADGTIDTVAAAVPASARTTPDDKIARRSGRGTFVIELAAGEAARDGLVRGVHLALQKPL